MKSAANDEPRKPRNLDLSGMKPTAVKSKPDVEAVKAVAKEQGFSSREAKEPGLNAQAVAAPAEQPSTPKRRTGPRRKGRTESFNTRLKPETLNAIIDICDERTWGYAEFVERALDAFKKTKG